MIAKVRRDNILEELNQSQVALKGSDLAERYSVSRQVIVQDIALLRASGHPILSTAEGYSIYSGTWDTHKRVFCVKHPESALEDELFLFVDNGGHVLNIIVDHPVYGEIVVDLMLKSRRQVKTFMKKVTQESFVPLMNLTGGYHYHTVEGDNEEILDDIEEELRALGYLIEE